MFEWERETIFHGSLLSSCRLYLNCTTQKKKNTASLLHFYFLRGQRELLLNRKDNSLSIKGRKSKENSLFGQGKEFVWDYFTRKLIAHS